MKVQQRMNTHLNPKLEVLNNLRSKGRFFKDSDNRIARNTDRTHVTGYIGVSGVGKSVLSEQRRQARQESPEIQEALDAANRSLEQFSLSQAEMFNYLAEKGIVDSPFGEWNAEEVAAASIGIGLLVWESIPILPYLTAKSGKKITPCVDIDAIGVTDLDRPHSWVAKLARYDLTSMVAIWGKKSLEEGTKDFRGALSFAKTPEDVKKLWEEYHMDNNYPMVTEEDVERYIVSMGNLPAMAMVKSVLGRIAEKHQSEISMGTIIREYFDVNPEHEEAVHKTLYNIMLGKYWKVRHFLVATNENLEDQTIHHYPKNSTPLIDLVEGREIPINLTEKIVYMRDRISESKAA